MLKLIERAFVKEESPRYTGLTSSNRQELINAAFQGATPSETRQLARMAMGKLSTSDHAALIREQDRELWARIVP